MTAVATASGCSGRSAWPAPGISTTVTRAPMSSCSTLALAGGAPVPDMGWPPRIGARPPAHQASSCVACVAAACASATARCHPPRQTAGARPGAKKARGYHVLGARHAARGDVPEEGRPGAGARAGQERHPSEGPQGMNLRNRSADATWADVNRDVIRTVGMPGNTYFAWMCLVGLTLAVGIAAWTWQIYVGMGAAGKIGRAHV